MMSGFP